MLHYQLENRLKKLERVNGTNESEVAVLSDVNDNLCNTLRSNVVVMEERIGNIQKMCASLENGLNTIKTKLFIIENYDLKGIPKITEKLSTIEHGLVSIQSQVEYLNRVAKREPSSNRVRVPLTDGKEHTFKEYKSVRGLAKPREISNDLIFGKRWIDLLEPED